MALTISLYSPRELRDQTAMTKETHFQKPQRDAVSTTISTLIYIFSLKTHPRVTVLGLTSAWSTLNLSPNGSVLHYKFTLHSNQQPRCLQLPQNYVPISFKYKNEPPPLVKGQGVNAVTEDLHSFRTCAPTPKGLALKLSQTTACNCSRGFCTEGRHARVSFTRAPGRLPEGNLSYP